MTSSEDSILPHLKAFRVCLLKCVAALGMGFMPAFFVASPALNRLVVWLSGTFNLSLNYFSPLEVFFTQLKIAFVLDVLICLPYLTYTLWHFILPGLYETERKIIRRLALFSGFLFFIGFVFGLFLITPALVVFGYSFETPQIHAVWSVLGFIDLTLKLSFVFGLMFQFPLITHVFIRWGLVSKEKMKHSRPYVLIGILILSALLTPPDIASQLLLAVPAYLLFEAALFISKKQKQ